MQLGFTTLSCPDWDLDRILAEAVKNGYEGVDFRGYRREMDVTALPLFTTELAQTRRKFAQAGVIIPCLSTGARMFNPQGPAGDIDEVTRYARLAQQVGAGYLRVFGGGLKGESFEQAIPTAVDTLGRLADAAAPFGVQVLVETHDDWVRSEPLAEVFARLERGDVGIIWDVHHPALLAGEDPATTWANLGTWVRYTHFKNSRRREDGTLRLVLPDEGLLDLDAMVALLVAGGYDGWLVLEWEKMWQPEIAEPEVALPAYAQALRNAWAKATGQG